jgi:hypothetical protein
MPEISRFFGIVIQMYFAGHSPPHFHAFYAGKRARVIIHPVGLLSRDLPPRVLALTVEWARIHQAELLENWKRLRSNQPALAVSPLE